ncbi:EAL domain-containing protein [Aurantimonas sp. MSK8Z-1]|uniref:putative bifunctional diguanylate cyclase/phosphodiesterase n=1 Tax=Mangrovibrevibacter kandeliae TaxID=2968473 RepID=UPI0021192A47|nr:GGDEF domain-containing phosphodiesterase [Aurantimonas sp. MSK8Z-1]MCW4116357.1 EAL domain-containing protein [Aurantimonas sp. MSK8Z-1]
MRTLWFYDWMARFDHLSYRTKIMLMAFLGTHVPLIALVFYTTISDSWTWQRLMSILGVTLLATLVGTAVTLFVLHQLLKPVVLTSRALRAYRSSRALMPLPVHYTDEVGTLMADATATIRHLHDAVDQLENVDPATGLPNRRRLVADIESRVADGRSFAVCIVRFGAYESIVHALDLEAAETAVRLLAQRLRRRLPSELALYRVDAGNFGVISRDGIDNAREIAGVGERMQALLADTGGVIGLPMLAVDPLLRAGVTAHPLDAVDANKLVDFAVAAAVQPTGRDTVSFHSPAARRTAVERIELEQELRRALSQDHFVLHYQPVVDLAQGRVVGGEALIRWQHPERGLLAPGAFIPAAETCGLINPIGLWVMRKACLQLRDWNAHGGSDLKIAVNLSARQFLDPGLLDFVRQSIDEAGIRPDQLEIELTETAAMADHDFTRAMFGRLRDIGVSIAIDDFGTGYASLSNLHKLPFDKLKIDREFVRDVHTARDRQAICGALVALAQGLGLELLAEGTEKAEEIAQLNALGCRLFQGFYFSKPLPAPDFPARVAEVSLAAMSMRMHAADGRGEDALRRHTG